MGERTLAQVLLFVPNVIGYTRLALIVASFHSGCFDKQPALFLGLYAANAALDGVDGAAARRLGQTSAFGAWLDVVVDNVGRSLLWCRLFPELGPWVSCLEWATFSCTHTIGEGWKMDFGDAPRLVLGVMANGFYNPLGVLAIGGLHGLVLYSGLELA